MDSQAPFNEYVWASSQPIGTTRSAVLFHLAVAWNSQRDQCNPSFDYLAKRIGASRNTVMRSIGQLRGMGLISRRRTRTSSKYTLNFSVTLTAKDVKAWDKAHPASEKSYTEDPCVDGQDGADLVLLDGADLVLLDGADLVPKIQTEMPSEIVDAHASASARASITIGQAEEEPTMTEEQLTIAAERFGIELSGDSDVDHAIVEAAIRKRERKQSKRTTANPPIPSLPSLDTPMPKAPSAIAALWASIALCYKREGLIAELTPKLHTKATKLLTECPLSMEEMEAIYAKLDRLDFGDRSVDIRLRKIDFALTGDGRNAILAAASSYTDGINSFQGLPLDKPFAELGGVNWRKALPMSEFHLSDHFDNHLEAYNAMTRMLKTARGVRNFRKAVNDVYMAGRRVHLNQWAELARIAQSDATMECNERKMHEQLEGGRNRD